MLEDQRQDKGLSIMANVVHLQPGLAQTDISSERSLRIAPCREKDAFKRGQDMAIRVCVAGVSGWTGSAVTRAILASREFELTGAIARRHAGRDTGELLGLPTNGTFVTAGLREALARPADVLVDFTSPDSVKQRTLEALAAGVRVVIGTSGLTAADYADIEHAAAENQLPDRSWVVLLTSGVPDHSMPRAIRGSVSTVVFAARRMLGIGRASSRDLVN
jgi:hypothetical protein